MSSPITIRVSDVTRRGIEDLAASQRTTVSDLLRSQINSLLGREDGVPDRLAPAGLTPIQRHMLIQNHEILAAVDPTDAEHHRSMIEVLRHGYTLEYQNEFADLYDELSPEDCRTVMDILDMFRICGYSITKLTDAEREALGKDSIRELTFTGFDGNDPLEGQMRGYVRHLVSTGRWQEVADLIDAKHDGGNSHMPMLPSYRRMLRTHRAVLAERRNQGGGFSHVYDFSLADLTKIAGHG